VELHRAIVNSGIEQAARILQILLLMCASSCVRGNSAPPSDSVPEREVSQTSDTTSPLACPETTIYILGGWPDSRTEVEAFCIDQLEVSVGDYRSCVESGTCTAPPDASYGTYPNPGSLPLEDRDRYPVNMVTWYEAVQFCEWRDARLPSAQEWLWAARGRDEQRVSPWGNDARAAAMCEPLPGDTPPCATGSSPVDRTRDGVLDMGGNVSEWTSTIVRDQAYAFGGGTSFLFPPAKKEPSTRAFDGFRCARDVLQPTPPATKGAGIPENHRARSDDVPANETASPMIAAGTVTPQRRAQQR
jgi:hypothetical protein